MWNGQLRKILILITTSLVLFGILATTTLSLYLLTVRSHNNLAVMPQTSKTSLLVLSSKEYKSTTGVQTEWSTV